MVVLRAPQSLGGCRLFLAVLELARFAGIDGVQDACCDVFSLLCLSLLGAREGMSALDNPGLALVDALSLCLPAAWAYFP